MKKLAFELLICGLVCTVQSNANDLTCEMATQTKKNSNIEEALGENSWQIRLALAEAMNNYSPAKKGKIQIDHSIQVLFNAVISGKLTSEQLEILPEYQDLFVDIEKTSILSARTKLASIQHKASAPKHFSEILVPVFTESSTEKSGISGFFSKLNPFSGFIEKNKIAKKYGPVISFIHADQMASLITGYNQVDRLPVLKYMMEPVQILSPKEVLSLLMAVPKPGQTEAFDYLISKTVGRFDFFKFEMLAESIKQLNPEVVLKMIAHSGSNWPLTQVLPLAKELPQITPNIFADYLEGAYGPKEIQQFIGTVEQLSLKEAQFLLHLYLRNTTDEEIGRTYYSSLIEKIYLPEEKKKLELEFKNLMASKTSLANNIDKTIVASKNSLASNKNKTVKNKLDVDDQYLEKLKAKWRDASDKIAIEVTAIAEYRLSSGQINSGVDFIKTFEYNQQLNGYYGRYRELIVKLWETHIDDFFALNPTESEFRLALAKCPDLKIALELAKTRLRNHNFLKASDYVSTLSTFRNFDNPYIGDAVNYRNGLSYLWHINAKKFVELHPTNAEFESAKSNCNNMTDMIALMDARLKYGNLEHEADIEDTFVIPWNSPTEAMIIEVAKFKKDYYESRNVQNHQ